MKEKNAIINVLLILDFTLGILVVAYCIWLTFSMPDVSYAWWQGVGVVLLFLVAVFLLGVIPIIGPLMILPLTPVVWDWWWRDVDLFSISLIAWALSIGAFVVKVLLTVLYVNVVHNENE